jgi:hypothetical protein
MALDEQNNIENLVFTYEGIEHRKAGTWGFCAYCQKQLYTCVNSFAILVDTDAENAKVIVEQKGKQIGWITLVPGINYFYWCDRVTPKIRLVRDEEEKFWFKNAGWCVLSQSPESKWNPVNLPTFKADLEEGLHHVFDDDKSFLNCSATKLFHISQISLLSKKNELPSERLLNKLKKLSNYFHGKRGHEFLPCFFKVSKKKVPESMRLGDVRVIEFVALDVALEAFNGPMEIPDLASPSFSDDDDFSDTSSDSGIRDWSQEEWDDFLIMM